MPAPLSGKLAAIKVNSGSNTATLAAMNWSLEIDPKAKDVSNFRDGRFRAVTGQDATWTATIVHDTSAAAWLSANGGLVDGAVVTAYCFMANNTNTNTAFIVPSMITKLNPKAGGFEDVVQIEITGMLHNGSITYPVS
jgi:hypothetical protein